MEKQEKIQNIIKDAEQKTEQKANSTQKNSISNDFAVLLKIYEITEIEHDLVYFTKLVEKTGYDRLAVSRNVDKLFDLGMIYGDWNYVYAESVWERTFHVEPDALPFVKSLFNCSLKNKNTEKKETKIENQNSENQKTESNFEFN